MKSKAIDHFLTGISISVASIRTNQTYGIGDFYDLDILGKWCNQIGIEVIQILPINDTGFQSSPYSALSAFALHPIFLRIQEIFEYSLNSEYLDILNQKRDSFENMPRVDFENLLKFKLDLLFKIYKNSIDLILDNKFIQLWINDNTWVKPYSVFNVIKKQNEYKHWHAWSEYETPDENMIDSYWNNNKEECFFYAWMQFRLEEQLIIVRKKLETLGIALKGDIPILINEDSVDIWYNRKYFNTKLCAGAPPDMFSIEGQNWGFPVYNWVELEKSGYQWWKERLQQANKFYSLYRIDHVLGFFRIWQIPVEDNTGVLGNFYPFVCIKNEDLNNIGFDKGRIRWLSTPHIHGGEINFNSLEKKQYVKDKYLCKIGNEDLYNLNNNINGEKYIVSLNEDEEIKAFLLFWYRNRCLVEIEKGLYQRSWTYTNSKAYKSLNYDEKMLLNKLFKLKEDESEKIWETEGTKLLSMMKNTTNMVMCAEDLGVVPVCVPKVLKKLDILSLKIERWAREYSLPNSPYINPKEYPRLSVCTPSVHDTTTIRGWWENELSKSAKQEYYQLLDLEGIYPSDYSNKLAKAIIKRNLDSNSIITIFQIQDILILNEQFDRRSFEDDRINVPGTVNKSNWTYRIPYKIEELINNKEFIKSLKSLFENRRKRSFVK